MMSESVGEYETPIPLTLRSRDIINDVRLQAFQLYSWRLNFGVASIHAL